MFNMMNMMVDDGGDCDGDCHVDDGGIVMIW